MKAAHVPPHGKIELPRWHSPRSPVIQRVFGTRRGRAGLVVLALVVALAFLGGSVALSPGRNDSAQVIAPGTVTLDPVALAATRDDWRYMYSQMQALKYSLRTVATGTVTLDPVALSAARDDWRYTYSQMQALKSSPGRLQRAR